MNSRLLSITLGILLISLISNTLWSQSESPVMTDISYTIKEKVKKGEVVYDLTVVFDVNSGSQSFRLYKGNTLLESNIIEESKTTLSNSYTFKNIPKGDYMVFINQDNKKVGTEYILLGTPKSTAQ